MINRRVTGAVLVALTASIGSIRISDQDEASVVGSSKPHKKAHERLATLASTKASPTMVESRSRSNSLAEAEDSEATTKHGLDPGTHGLAQTEKQRAKAMGKQNKEGAKKQKATEKDDVRDEKEDMTKHKKNATMEEPKLGGEGSHPEGSHPEGSGETEKDMGKEKGSTAKDMSYGSSKSELKSETDEKLMQMRNIMDTVDKLETTLRTFASKAGLKAGELTTVRFDDVVLDGEDEEQEAGAGEETAAANNATAADKDPVPGEAPPPDAANSSLIAGKKAKADVVTEKKHDKKHKKKKHEKKHVKKHEDDDEDEVEEEVEHKEKEKDKDTDAQKEKKNKHKKKHDSLSETAEESEKKDEKH